MINYNYTVISKYLLCESRNQEQSDFIIAGQLYTIIHNNTRVLWTSKHQIKLPSPFTVYSPYASVDFSSLYNNILILTLNLHNVVSGVPFVTGKLNLVSNNLTTGTIKEHYA